MELISHSLDGILVLKSSFQHDTRGAFHKLFDEKYFAFRPYTVRQLNHVTTLKKHTFRGLHFQSGAYAESKIFKVMTGSILFIALNILETSPFYGQKFTTLVSTPDLSIWTPRGYATGYLSMEDNTSLIYTSDNDYSPSFESGIRWNDPILNILDLKNISPILSDKDRKWADF